MKYVRDGAQKWHAVDAGKTQTVYGREAHVTVCGATILTVCEAFDLEAPPLGLCVLCIYEPTEEQKKQFRRNYLRNS